MMIRFVGKVSDVRHKRQYIEESQKHKLPVQLDASLRRGFGQLARYRDEPSAAPSSNGAS